MSNFLYGDLDYGDLLYGGSGAPAPLPVSDSTLAGVLGSASSVPPNMIGFLSGAPPDQMPPERLPVLLAMLARRRPGSPLPLALTRTGVF